MFSIRLPNCTDILIFCIVDCNKEEVDCNKEEQLYRVDELVRESQMLYVLVLRK